MAGDKINGSGALFNNKRKTKDTQPDYTGNFKMSRDLLKSYIEAFRKDPGLQELTVDLAAWKRNGRSGDFISVSVSPPYEKRTPAKDALDDDIPF